LSLQLAERRRSHQACRLNPKSGAATQTAAPAATLILEKGRGIGRPQGKDIMTIEALKDALPDYARDLKLNLSSLAQESQLTQQQRAGAFVACALASRNQATICAVMESFAPTLSSEALAGAKAAAAIMAMNNIYYRFTHLASAQDYKTLPARLRMNVIANPGVDKTDFELWCLAVSAINGCGVCIDSHEKVLREAGLLPEQIQAVVRIAAVIHAIAVTLEGEMHCASTPALAA
jgi:alkyl hydroperoxide reductase subunit D